MLGLEYKANVEVVAVVEVEETEVVDIEEREDSAGANDEETFLSCEFSTLSLAWLSLKLVLAIVSCSTLLASSSLSLLSC